MDKKVTTAPIGALNTMPDKHLLITVSTITVQIHKPKQYGNYN